MSDPNNLMRMIPTAELPVLAAAFEAHARRNYERLMSPGEPDYVQEFSRQAAARYKSEADRIQFYYLRRLAHERPSALG